MVAVDTNILIHAHRPDSPNHEAAQAALTRLGLSGERWCIAWPCAQEFLAVVTCRVFKSSASKLDEALATLQGWIVHPQCLMISETPNHMQILSAMLVRSKVVGGTVHDARIAAICIGNGVTELWSADRDFRMFPDLQTRNPLIASLHEPLVHYQAKPAPVRRAPARRA